MFPLSIASSSFVTILSIPVLLPVIECFWFLTPVCFSSTLSLPNPCWICLPSVTHHLCTKPCSDQYFLLYLNSVSSSAFESTHLPSPSHDYTQPLALSHRCFCAFKFLLIYKKDKTIERTIQNQIFLTQVCVVGTFCALLPQEGTNVGNV